MLRYGDMASMATQTANSSKKAESRESHDERGAGHEPGAPPGEVGKNPGGTPGDERSRKPASAEPEALDSALDDPYDNVACTD